MYQDLPLPKEEGKTAKTYPDEKTERNVFRNRLYCCCCCNTTNINDKHVLSCTFSNASGDTVYDHTIGDNGYCTHCNLDCRKPIITPEPLPDATEREHYTVTFATDGTPTDELTYEIITSEADETAYELPNGLDIYESGSSLEIYGSPNEYGTFTFTVKATNKYGSSYKTYTLIINQNTVPSFAITTKELPEGVVGEDYKCMLETNSKESVYWSITKGFELPGGLTLDEKTGLIYGIPEKEGSYKTSITAYCEKEEAQANFSLIISAEKSEYGLYYDYRTLFVTCAKAGEYTLVFANYDKTGKMTDIKTLTRELTQGRNAISALSDVVALETGDKIFLWESLGTLKPLCGAFTVK